MATLCETLIGDTYCSLIKAQDNNSVSAPVQLSDGSGNLLSLTLGPQNTGISVTGSIGSNGNISAGGNVIGGQITGNTCITTTGNLYAATTTGNCVGIGTITPNQKLTVSGSISANGDMYLDKGKLYACNGEGSSTQILQSTGANIKWIDPPAGAGCTGTVCGTGTTNYVTKFTNSTTIGNSIIQDNGSLIGIGVAPGVYKLKVGGGVCATGFTGPITGNLTGNICGNTTVGGNLTVNSATSLVGAVGMCSTLTTAGQATLASAKIQGVLKDCTDNTGTAGYVLQSTGAGIRWASLTSLPSATTAGRLSPGAAIGITGAVTGAGVTFTGASPISINTTGINGSCITSGTVPDARISSTVKLAAGKDLTNGITQRDRVAYVESNGVMEIGKYIDFHDADSCTADCSVRLESTNGVLDLTGTFKASGDIIAFATSDERLKDNKKCITDANNIINGLNNYCFDWNDKSGREGPGIGVLAQDVQKVLPNAVCERENGYLAIDYNQFIPVLLQRVKELSAEVEELKAKIN